MFDISITTVSGLAAVLIATLASIVGIVVSKEIKVSEFRQQWIDSLRAELSSLISHLSLLRIAGTFEYDSKHQEFISIEKYLLSANEMVNKIRLRLNKKKYYHNQIIELLRELEDFVNSKDLEDLDEFTRLENNLISLSAKLLKSEWERVKDGENTFRSAKDFFYKVCRLTTVALISVSILVVLYITGQVFCFF